MRYSDRRAPERVTSGYECERREARKPRRATIARRTERHAMPEPPLTSDFAFGLVLGLGLATMASCILALVLI